MQSEGVKWNRPGEMSWIGKARDTRLNTETRETDAGTQGTGKHGRHKEKRGGNLEPI